MIMILLIKKITKRWWVKIFVLQTLQSLKIRNIFKINTILGLWNQIKDSRRVKIMLLIIISQINLISLLQWLYLDYVFTCFEFMIFGRLYFDMEFIVYNHSLSTIRGRKFVARSMTKLSYLDPYINLCEL